jgi:hypothetical protein
MRAGTAACSAGQMPALGLLCRVTLLLLGLTWPVLLVCPAGVQADG